MRTKILFLGMLVSIYIKNPGRVSRDWSVYFWVMRNQSTSAHPPSLVTMAGRVQNIPTLEPIHWPSLAWKALPNLRNFFSVGAVAELAHDQQVGTTFAFVDAIAVGSELYFQIDGIVFQSNGFV